MSSVWGGYFNKDGSNKERTRALAFVETYRHAFSVILKQSYLPTYPDSTRGVSLYRALQPSIRALKTAPFQAYAST